MSDQLRFLKFYNFFFYAAFGGPNVFTVAYFKIGAGAREAKTRVMVNYEDFVVRAFR